MQRIDTMHFSVRTSPLQTSLSQDVYTLETLANANAKHVHTYDVMIEVFKMTGGVVAKRADDRIGNDLTSVQ